MLRTTAMLALGCGCFLLGAAGVAGGCYMINNGGQLGPLAFAPLLADWFVTAFPWLFQGSALLGLVGLVLVALGVYRLRPAFRAREIEGQIERLRAELDRMRNRPPR